MKLTVKQCMTLAERAVGLPKGATYTRSRAREIAWARQAGMLLAHENGNSYSHIARMLNMDHTTIMHGVKAARERRERLLSQFAA